MAALGVATDVFAFFHDTPLGPLIPLILALSLLFFSKRYLNSTDPSLPRLPPGPPHHFLWGTTLPSHSWRQFELWTKEFGEVFTVYPGGRKPLVVVGTYKAAKELLEGEWSGSTAGRPGNIVPNIISNGNRILSITNGEKWRRLRKALHQGLQPRMAASYEPIQLQGAIQFMLDLISFPTAFQEHASVYAASVIMSITYGKTTPTRYTDPEIVKVTKCLGRVGYASKPGSYLVESYPFLRFIPAFLSKWKRDALEWHEEEKELFLGQFLEVKLAEGGKGKECFASWLIEHQKEYELSDEEAAYLLGSMFGAGSDTTASALSIAIMAMTLYPEVAIKARQLIEKLVGRSRAPDFSDFSDLIYIQAFIKEVHRWRPVSSGGFSHATTAPITYQGYVIPSGTSIVGNHWSISRDAEVFPEPDRFWPERWLDQEAGEVGLRKDLHHVGFGFGRRICSGKNVADRSLFINIALLLWSFEFSPKKDENGKDIPIDDLGFTNAPNSHPLPYQVDIKPIAGAKKILESMVSSL